VQSPLDRCEQPRGARELRRLRTPREALRDALGLQRPIVAPLRTTTADLPPYRRAMPSQSLGDLAIALTSMNPDEDPLALGKRQPVRRARRISATSSRSRDADDCASPNSSITSLTRAPERNRAAIDARSGGVNNRYDPRRPLPLAIRPPITQHENTIVLRRPDETAQEE
jgi:hypothetical protein